ncbi:MAG: SDR family oxidoreductase [Bauldia sp.]|nr:SDR family oxidoreductase [Bauldia sp.]
MDMQFDTDRFDLRERRIMVTGASRGLGRGIALAIAATGATVVGVARSRDGLSETQSMAAPLAGRFETMAGDLANTEELDAIAADAWAEGPLDGVVHAAGIQVRKPAVTITREDWQQVASIQIETPFFLSTAIARRQLDTGRKGSHVFIGSLASSIGLPEIAPYTAAKSGILGLTRTLAIEWARSGLRVNAVCPGYFHTELTNDLFSDPARRDRLLGRIPMGRFGVADDLAGAVIFFLCDASCYVTGQALSVDGGWLAG